MRACSIKLQLERIAQQGKIPIVALCIQAKTIPIYYHRITGKSPDPVKAYEHKGAGSITFGF